MPGSFPSLCTAILKNDRTQVKALLKSDPSLATFSTVEDENYESEIAHWIYTGDSALHIAAAGYRVEIAKMLLAAGADQGSAANRRSSQPLHYASDGHPDSPAWNPGRQVAMIQLLLKAGAHINARDKNGATPLHRAVRTRCATAVKEILASGGDPASRNKPGSTPFHLAVQNTGRGGSGGEKVQSAQCEIIQAFLDRGISPTLKDAKGKSVLQWARSGWIHQMLAEHAV